MLLLLLLVFLVACDKTENGEGVGGAVSTDPDGNDIFVYGNSEPLYYDDLDEPTLQSVRIHSDGVVYVEWYCKNELGADNRYTSQAFALEEYMLHQGTITFSEDEKTAEIRIPNEYAYKVNITGDGAEEYREYLHKRMEDGGTKEELEKTLNGEYGLTMTDSRNSGMSLTVTIHGETGRFVVTELVLYEGQVPSAIAVFDDILVKKQFFNDGVLSEQEELTEEGHWETHEYYADGTVRAYSLRTADGKWLREYRYFEDGSLNYEADEDENGNYVTYGYNEDGSVYYFSVKQPSGESESYSYYETGAVWQHVTVDAEGRSKTQYYDRDGNLTSSSESWKDDEGKYHERQYYPDGSWKQYTVYDESWEAVLSESYQQGEKFS